MASSSPSGGLSESHLRNLVLDNSKHKLKLLNSFTRKKEIFVSSASKTITWYTCGPTVYDVAHLGHARCYITFDIIRRILSDYFGYKIRYIMNITDIDDKIIKRARGNYLCDKFIEQYSKADQFFEVQNLVIDQLKLAIESYAKKIVGETDVAKLEMLNKILDKSNQSLTQLQNLAAESKESKAITDQNLKQVLSSLSDVIAEYQDSKLAHTVTEHDIFRALTIRYEQEFHDDMQKLDVLPPSALTRVSEYIDEIGAYIKKLESNGFAYRAGGSVYFDVAKFDSDPKHRYAKLVREAYGQKENFLDGEGELSVSGLSLTETKKSPNDFALWKKSKPGEPIWNTEDYEPGRPGWHIECSVMATQLLGNNFDIHSGGCDLKFPHHDNEIAQAEAYFNTGESWVNYFIHSGHLTISGCKMSKSLKNFITIRQALDEYTSRQIRFAFLSHGWTETLDYSTNTMSTACTYEKTFREFFLNVMDHLRRRLNNLDKLIDDDHATQEHGLKVCRLFQKWSSGDCHLNAEFLATIDKVDAALCDNIDTRSVLNHLVSLIRSYNKQITPIAPILIKDIASYIQNTLHVFGTGFDELDLEQLFKLSSSSVQAGEKSTGSQSEVTMKYVDALANFRADVRQICKSGEITDSVKQILKACDTLRDQTLPNLGVRLEDKVQDGLPYVVKLVDPETLARERAQAEKLAQEKAAAKAAKATKPPKQQKVRAPKKKPAPTPDVVQAQEVEK